MTTLKYSTITTILVLTLATGCNFYKIRENQIINKFTRAGLVSKTFKSKATNVHYWIGGKTDGNTLLLIHGFGADSKFQWYDQVGLLAKKYRLVIPDLLFFGDSFSSKKDFSVNNQADTIIRLIKELQISQFSILAISYGGLVAITITDKMPATVNSLVLCDSPIKFYSSRDNEKALKFYKADTIQDLLIPVKPEGIPRLLKLAYYKPRVVPKFALKNIHENMFKSYNHEKGQLLEYMKQNERMLSQKKYRVHCRVLLIWGSDDILIPPRIGHQLKKYLKGKAELKIIDKTAHMPNLEKPDVFNRIMMDFLEDTHE